MFVKTLFPKSNLSSLNVLSNLCLYYLIFILTISLLVGCTTPSIVVTKEQKAGDAAFNQYEYRAALLHYQRASDAAMKLGIYRSPEMEAELHRKAANCYEMSGVYDSAIWHVREALLLDSANGNRQGMIADYRQLGNNYIYAGLYRKSLAPLEKSLMLSEGMEQSLKTIHQLAGAETYLTLGRLYSVTAEPQTAIDCIEKSLALFKQANDSRGEMEASLAFADIYADRGDTEQARQQVALSEKIAVAENFSVFRHNRLSASIAMNEGLYEEALRFQEKALQEANKYGIFSQIIWMTIGMGDIYHAIGDASRAERYYRTASEANASKNLQASLDMRLGDLTSARDYFSAEGALTGEGISSLRLSEMMLKSGNIDSSEYFADRAHRLFSASGNRQGYFNSLLCRGKILIEQGLAEKARQTLEIAKTADDYPEMQWQAWFHTGRAYEALNDEQKAKEAYYAAISIIEKIRGNFSLEEFRSLYFNNKQEVYDRLIFLLFKSGDYDEAFKTSEQAKARAFYETLANKTINFGKSAPDPLIMAEQEKRNELQKLFQLLHRYNETEAGAVTATEEVRSVEIREIKGLISDKQEEYDELIQKIKWSNPEYSELIAVAPVNMSALRENIDEKTAILSYRVMDNAIILWVVAKDTAMCSSIPTGRDELEALIEETRRYIPALHRRLPALLKELYAILLSSVETAIGAVSELVILPNGSLHFLPFQALIDGDGKYLVEKYDIIYAPSGGVYSLCQSKPLSSGNKFMGMALSDVAIDYYDGLPGTEEELKKILPFFTDHISGFGLESTETFAKTNAPNYDFLHFATHGVYHFRQPLYSHLLFPASENDDGQLNVYEVFEMNLNAKLVTLSACETGIGQLNRGDELIGLSRAFLFAGASAVTVSLWQVADYQTALLMQKFYTYLEEHSAQKALTLAQREILREYPQPFFWAPFVLLGQGNVMKN